jgi:hypothetical protein
MHPLIFVIAITAVQLTVAVVVSPRARLPKSTGELHDSALATGEPMQITFPLESDTYNRPSPNAGRMNLFRPPVGGMVMAVRTPFTGTALNACNPALGSVTHRIPVPAWPLYVVTVGIPIPTLPAALVLV